MYFVMWHTDFSKASLLSKRHVFSRYTRKCTFIHAHKNITAFPVVDIHDKNVQRRYMQTNHIDCTKIGRYTGCPRRNVKYFGRVFLMLNYTDITQNTYIQS